MSNAPKVSQETIFVDALGRSPEERATYVDRACGDDRAMAVRVKELLRGYEENSGFLENPPAGADGAGAGVACSEPGRRLDTGHNEHLHEPVPGDRIGHYKLLERIGEGACGIVYMAEQEQPVRRRVALKLIKLGLDTRDFIARFEAERQALALMDHPNIAHVFDAGATDRGRPYFVMELVRGVPITRYCDENHLAPPARLELLIQVCHAIQHAHQKGVIHRDIKPSNILVAVNDGVPVPKVIDFGIAKATQGRLTDKTMFTRFHAFIGTPAYSSPEQAGVTNLDVDTRSDIYSLGVLLYELLTGHQPVDAATIERLGFEELRRVIREVDPPRPSARVSSLGHDDRTSVALRRSVDAAKLAPLLRSDLDWIVMRCLEKDRRRRYESASTLAQDIRRHLDDEPVAARPPSAAYRTQKFIRRHKPAFVAVTGIAAALVAGLIVSAALLVRERAARARAVEAEHAESELRAQAEAGRAREIKRSSRAALNLAKQLLAQGKSTDGLAYLVHAARRDPENTAIAARLVSTLTSQNFLLPEHATFASGSRFLALRYSNDGQMVYAGSEDGTLRVFDAFAGTVVREVRLGQPVKRNGWVFPRDDDRVCVVRFVGETIGVLDLTTGRLRFPPLSLDPRVLPGEGLNPAQYDAGKVHMSPDGRWVLAEGLFEFWLWDAASGELRMQHSFSKFKFWGFSTDGTRLAEISDDALTVWSLPEGTKVFGPVAIARRFNMPGTYLMPHFSRDGRELAIVNPAEAIHVFDAASGELLRSWPHEDNWIHPGLLKVLPDGRLFVNSASSTELLDLKSGLSARLPHTQWRNVQACASDASGARILIVTPEGFGQLIESTRGAWVAEQTAFFESGDVVAALAPDGNRIVTGTGQGELRWLRVGRGAAQPLQFPAIAARFTFGDQTHVRVVTNTDSRTIAVQTGRDVGERVHHPREIPADRHSSSLSPGARFLVVRDAKGTSESWDFSPGNPPRVAAVAEDLSLGSYNFSPDGDFIAFAGASRDVRVVDLATGRLFGTPVRQQNETLGAWTLKIGTGGRMFVTGYTNGTVSIWETPTGRMIRTLKSTSRSTPSVVHLSADERRIIVATALGEARIWDVATGDPVSPIFEVAPGGHGLAVAAGALFSPDGRWLATVGSQATTLRDATSYDPVGQIIPVGSEGPDGVFFSHDGTRLFGGGAIWDVPSGELITELRDEAETRKGTYDNALSPDGKYLLYRFNGPTGPIARIRSVPPPLPQGALIPEWLLDLTTVIAGKSVNEAEQSVAVPGAMIQIDAVRRQLAFLPADAPYVEWGRWILDDRPERPIAPGFTITPAEMAKLADNIGR